MSTALGGYHFRFAVTLGVGRGDGVVHHLVVGGADNKSGAIVPLCLFVGGRVPLSSVWVMIPTEQMAACSGEQTDILTGFQINPAPIIRVRSRSSLLMLLKNLAVQLQNLPDEELRFGIDLMEQSTIQMFLALVLRICVQEDPHRAKPETRFDNRLSLDEVFSYIHNHLTEDLSLARLEQEFYVSRHHLIREFKKRTGQTVHQYIIKARLELSRNYCVKT